MLLGQSFSQALVGLGVFCGALVAIFTAMALVAKLPPVRWLWRQLVSGPLERFSTRIVRDGAAQFHTEVVAPQMHMIESKVDDLVAQGETSWHKDKAWIVSRVTLLEARYNYIRDRQETFRREMAAVLTGEQDLDEVRLRVLAALNQPGGSEPKVAD